MLNRRAPWIAALVAAGAGLPGLWFPFLSDDWIQVAEAADGFRYDTPFGDFRPLYMGLLWVEYRLFGLNAGLYHLTNLTLVAVCAALVVVTLQRLVADTGLASWSGLLFAVHPYHVENTAWIGARSDPLYAVFFLLAVLAFERWQVSARGLPWLALLGFELALLSKETALTLPFLLALVGWVDPARRRIRHHWWRGVLALLALLGLHFAMRFWLLGGIGRTLTQSAGLTWLKNALGYAAAAILPAPTQLLAAAPFSWGATAATLAAALVVLARFPRAALGGAAAFAVLIGPGVVGFHERYLFLASAGSALVIVLLLRHISGRRHGLSLALATLIALGWAGALRVQWSNWWVAAQASRALVDELSDLASQNPDAEIVLANTPFEIRGGSIGGDFASALRLRGVPVLAVRAASWISYGSTARETIASTESSSVVRLRPLPDTPYDRFIGPRPSDGSDVLTTDVARLSFENDGHVRIEVLPGASSPRLAAAWSAGHLVPF